jgi:hypothetical protein
MWALAPEECFVPVSPKIPMFSAAGLAPAFCFPLILRASERFFTSRLARRSIVFSFLGIIVGSCKTG